MPEQPKKLTETQYFRKYWNDRLAELYTALEQAYATNDLVQIVRLEHEIACIYREYPSYAKTLQAGTPAKHSCNTCRDEICTSRCIQ